MLRLTLPIRHVDGVKALGATRFKRDVEAVMNVVWGFGRDLKILK